MLRGGVAWTLQLAPWILLVLWLVYVASFASFVRTDAEAITVQNLLRRTRIPWPAVEDISIRLQLQITTTDGRRVSCLAGPSTVRQRASARAASDDLRVPPAVVTLGRIRDAWQSGVACAPSGPVRRGWDYPLAVTGGALLLVGIIASTSVGSGS